MDSQASRPGPRPDSSGGGAGAAVLDSGREALIQRLRSQVQGLNEVRRGVCLINAGRFHEAGLAFSRASAFGYRGESLASLMAACHLGQGETREAAELFGRQVERTGGDPSAVIRHALTLWRAGKPRRAVDELREAIRRDPDCAELHFQLGTLLSELDELDEAELRFTQAANLDRQHADALVSLALCCGVRQAPGEALAHLQRAQARRPHDPKIGFLLAQAATAAYQAGRTVRVRAALPDEDTTASTLGLAELTDIIEHEPDFVDAFLSLPIDEVDSEVFTVLLRTLEQALARQPEQAELHFHCGQVLARLGRAQEAIDANERAVGLRPRYLQALIELGKLYAQTDRRVDATARLEQAVRAGARYADVFYLLGNLYRDQGHLSRAKRAYDRALSINDRYEDARHALAALACS